jgi:hypothetical protein
MLRLGLTNASQALLIVKRGLLAGVLLSAMAGIMALPAQARPIQDPPPPVVAADKCGSTFFGLVPWYHYLNNEFQPGTCNVKCFNIFNVSVPNECGQSKSDIPGVLLAIVDDLLRIAGFVALTFVLVSAFRYTTSVGEPDKHASAQHTLINALIGLAIAIVSIAFVSFVGNKLGGTVH